jgi:hypothetical protein
VVWLASEGVPLLSICSLTGASGPCRGVVWWVVWFGCHAQVTVLVHKPRKVTLFGRSLVMTVSAATVAQVRRWIAMADGGCAEVRGAGGLLQ